MEEKYIQILIENQQSCKSAHHRLDGFEKKLDNIQELTVAVKEIAMETKATREDVNDMNNRLKKVEEEPAANWKNLKWMVVTRNCYSNSGLFIR